MNEHDFNSDAVTLKDLIQNSSPEIQEKVSQLLIDELLQKHGMPPRSLLKRMYPNFSSQSFVDWFNWGNEFRLLMSLYCNLEATSNVLEIGCLHGRNAHALIPWISPPGSYDGFDVSDTYMDWLHNNFQKKYPYFRFKSAGNLYHSSYNPNGTVDAATYVFPYSDSSIDIVFAASVFTHMLPQVAANYFKQISRVLRPGGRALISVNILDYYDISKVPENRRDLRMESPLPGYEEDVLVRFLDRPDHLNCFSVRLLDEMIDDANLRRIHDVIPGLLASPARVRVTRQSMLIIEKPVRES